MNIFHEMQILAFVTALLIVIAAIINEFNEGERK